MSPGRVGGTGPTTTHPIAHSYIPHQPPATTTCPACPAPMCLCLHFPSTRLITPFLPALVHQPPPPPPHLPTVPPPCHPCMALSPLVKGTPSIHCLPHCGPAHTTTPTHPCLAPFTWGLLHSPFLPPAPLQTFYTLHAHCQLPTHSYHYLPVPAPAYLFGSGRMSCWEMRSYGNAWGQGLSSSRRDHGVEGWCGREEEGDMPCLMPVCGEEGTYMPLGGDYWTMRHSPYIHMPKPRLFYNYFCPYAFLPIPHYHLQPCIFPYNATTHTYHTFWGLCPHVLLG